jgi:putative oxidoreductase
MEKNMMNTISTSAREASGLKRYTDALAPYTLTLLRVLVGITFFLHGLPKLSNLDGFTGFLTSLGVPLPGVAAPVIMVLEVVGGLLLIAGLGTRWISILFAVQMLVTTLLVKSGIGFIAPQGAPGVGAELDLLLLACSLILLAYGSGQLSVERNILQREL